MVIRTTGLKARNTWRREGEVQMEMTRMKLDDMTKTEEFCSQVLIAASSSFGKAVTKNS